MGIAAAFEGHLVRQLPNHTDDAEELGEIAQKESLIVFSPVIRGRQRVSTRRKAMLGKAVQSRSRRLHSNDAAGLARSFGGSSVMRCICS